MKLLSNIFSKVVYACCLSVLLLVGAFFALPYIPGQGTLDVKIVKSGSMEPTINTGGVVLIHERASYGVGDVVTFESRGADIPTTHRIIGTEVAPDGGTYFVTKGDANEERDVELLAEGDIIGTILLDVPYIGFILDFARQPVGFALLIGLPALLIIIDEVEKLWKAYRNRKRDDEDPDDNHNTPADTLREEALQNVYVPLVVPPLPLPRRVVMLDIVPKPAVPTQTLSLREHFAYETHARNTSRLAPSVILVTLVFGFSSLLHPFGGTVAFYRNTETSTGNTLSTETIDFLLKPDGNSFTFVDGEVNDPDGALMTLVAPTDASSVLRYDVRVEYATGSPAFCNAIQVVAYDPIDYFGLLTGLAREDVTLDTAWVLAFELNEGTYVSGDICEVDVVYRGWNETQDPGDGYEDEERTRLVFTTTETVLPSASLTELSVSLVEETETDEEVPEESETNGGGGGDESGSEVVEEAPLSEETLEETEEETLPEETTEPGVIEETEEVVEPEAEPEPEEEVVEESELETASEPTPEPTE
jgi:signal peptidase I